jgi:Acetyltransferases, including N-acetylases of ribosomal proteins
MKIFETERLTIRTLDENDIDRLVEYRSKKTVSQYQSWNRYTKRDAVKLIKKCKDTVIDHKKGYVCSLVITIKGKATHLIGDLHIEIMAPHTFSIGYTLDDVFWNNGFGTEAVLGLLSYMYEEHGFFKCIAYIYKQNEKSRHLLKKIGFKKFDESFFYGDEGYIFDLGNLQNIYFVLQ